MTQPSVIVVAPKGFDSRSIRRSLLAAGGGLEVQTSPDPAVLQDAEAPVAVFTTSGLLQAAREALGTQTTRIFVLCEEPDEAALECAVEDHRIGGLMAWGQGGAEDWEMRYLMRRLVAPKEPPPHMGQLLGWGVTTIAFRPRTTADQRALVTRVELMAGRLGLPRRQAVATSSAAHELTMNAMYDAPVDEEGRLKYALERSVALELLNHEVPTLRLTVSPDFVALDISDPFGRLPRVRYFQGVLRGHRNLKYHRSEMDLSHGGAGLGLHTLYLSGSAVRAELHPTRLTHVSWVLDRRPKKPGQRPPRSLYFLPSSGEY